jgi:uncharacterized protein
MISNGLLSAIRLQYRLDWHGMHGVSHWARVRVNGLRLSASSGADPIVVELFSFLHDSCRLNDNRDLEHGHRAAELALRFQGQHFTLNDRQLNQLTTACRDHTHGVETCDPTIATCWDADRLDLWRVGIQPDPDRLLTALAKSPVFMNCAIERSRRWLEQLPC